ncbi:MAG TPA: FecR domain-containing protein [Candidatus Lustribacter sp.]|jgi:hypothetical protein|nr:FecR domain-containing protein [Candidatus Lustribacter sp.]
MISTATPADNDKLLGRLKGVVGFASAPGAQLHEVFGRELIPDDDYAITHENSAAILALPDSSIVAIGQNTRVRVGAFNQTADGPGSTITVEQGTLRFDIKRPAGGTANYHFQTNTSQIAVRGTVGLLSVLAGNTTVACLVCAADSVTVSVAGQTLALATGQMITVSALGTIVTSTVTTTAMAGFSGASVSTAAASGPAAATAGVSGVSSAAASAAGAGASSAAGAAAAGAAGAAGAGAATGAIVGGAAAAAAAGVAVSAAAATTKPTPAASAGPNTNLQVTGTKTAAPAPAALGPRTGESGAFGGRH